MKKNFVLPESWSVILNNTKDSLPNSSGLCDQVLAWTELTPDKTAIVCSDAKLSYAQLRECVAAMVGVFRQQGLEKRRIALHYKNSIELVVAALAAARLEVTLIPINVALRPAQLAKQLEVVCADAVVTSASGARIVQRIASAVHSIVMPSLDDMLNVDCLDDLAALGEVSTAHDFIITLSSGSTGNPKPIVLSQQVKIDRAAQAAQSYDVTSEDVILCASPFYHSLGQRLCFVPLLYGATLVLLEHFTVDAWLDGVRDQGVSFTIAVSSHLQALRQSLFDETEGLQSLRCLVTSSAAMDYGLKLQLMQRLGCEFHEMYGATEVATATNLFPSCPQEKSESVGKPLPSISIRILGDDKASLEVGEVGEIACRSPLVFSGYDQRTELTEASFHDGYFLTGDLGYLDAQGYLYFVSRKKDIIISGGVNIVPGDIESALLTHDGLADCCVIATRDDYLGEVVLAVCVLLDDAVTEIDLKLHVNKHLAGYQHPKHYVFLDEIPLTPSGKPDKQKLRADYGDLGQGR